MKKADKKAVVSDVAAIADRAVSLVTADYRGLKGVELTALRATARACDVRLRVVPNNLMERAVVGTSFECINDRAELVGPNLFAFALNAKEPGAAARLLKEFSKTNPKLSVKMLAIGGKAYPGKDLDMLATLKTYDEEISSLLSVMQGTVSKLVRTLVAFADKQGAN